jgi:carbamoylphosphate synthase large subunit
MAIDVIFVEPTFPPNQREFVRALHQVGARVTGIGERPKGSLDSDVASWLFHYEQISNVTDERALEGAVRFVQQHTNVARLEAVVEAHVLAAARVRERCGIPGTTVQTTHLCRDKPAMKEALRKAGVPCARSLGSSDMAEIRAFAADVGYPLIVKPRDAAGASGTTKVGDARELEADLVARGVPQGRSVAVEEFISGHEGVYDTITLGGHVVHDFAGHYYPGVLEAMRTRWISPQYVSTNRLDSTPGYRALRDVGRQAIAALGIETSATHMEWFASPKGIVFSEIACRPAGVRTWDLYAAGNDFDIYREWAMMVVHGHPSQQLSRRAAAGIVALRPDRDGRIVGYDGVQEIERRCGQFILDAYLPPAGTPTQPVEAGYMANAWIRMRHVDYDQLREMLDFAGRTVKVRAS